jgi:hypothetical protein
MSILRSCYTHNYLKGEHPELSPEELDDILATVEELARRYGDFFFDQKTTLPNVLRLTAMKYIVIKNVLNAIISGEQPAVQQQVRWAKKQIGIVSKKLDELREIQSQYPDYPVTHLSPEEETAKAIEICESKLGKSIIAAGGILEELVLSDLSVIYYLFPTKKEKPMKYTALLKEFKPDFDDADYIVITEGARDTAKILKLRMTDPLNVDNFFAFLIRSVDVSIKATEEILEGLDENSRKMSENIISLFKASRSLFTDNKEQLLKEFAKKGIEGRDLLVAISQNDVNNKKIIASPLVNTIGDLLVAIAAITSNK